MRAGIDPSYDSKRYDGERYQAFVQDVHLILTGHALQCYATEYWQRIRESIQRTEIKPRRRHETDGQHLLRA